MLIVIHYLTDKKVMNLMVTSNLGFDRAEYMKTIKVCSYEDFFPVPLVLRVEIPIGHNF
jgi:hypothetical protein